MSGGDAGAGGDGDRDEVAVRVSPGSVSTRRREALLSVEGLDHPGGGGWRAEGAPVPHAPNESPVRNPSRKPGCRC